jgi:hypothetical protein
MMQKLILPTPLPQRTKRSSGTPGYVGQPLVLGSACIDKLFKFICNSLPQSRCDFGDPSGFQRRLRLTQNQGSSLVKCPPDISQVFATLASLNF